MSAFENVSEDNILDTAWLEQNVFSYQVSSVTFDDMSGAGGLSGAEMRRMRVVSGSDGKERTYVVKNIRSAPQNLMRAQSLGLPREALFFQELTAGFRDSVPQVHLAFGDMRSGAKYLILEDMGAAVQSGYFFGPGSPLNWGRDLEKEMSRIPPLVTAGSELSPMEVITQAACLVAARVHGLNWRNEKLRERKWLRGCDWLSGQGEAAWQAGQQMAADSWKTLKTKIGESSYGVKWSPLVIELVEASVAKTSWEQFQERMQQEHWTLVHGDFHPANMMWRGADAPTEGDASGSAESSVELEEAKRLRKLAAIATGANSDHPIHQMRSASAAQGDEDAGTPYERVGRLVLLDWEMVGIGCGAQDIGQYFISHVAPEQRRRCETDMLRLYYHELLSYTAAAATDGADGAEGDKASQVQSALLAAKERYTWEQCLSDYVRGGTERWMWFLPFLGTMCPDPMVQYFHDQVEAFARDHGVTAQSVGMPRV